MPTDLELTPKQKRPVGERCCEPMLRGAGIVGSERQGLCAYYYVRPEALEEFAAWLA